MKKHQTIALLISMLSSVPMVRKNCLKDDAASPLKKASGNHMQGNFESFRASDQKFRKARAISYNVMNKIIETKKTIGSMDERIAERLDVLKEEEEKLKKNYINVEYILRGLSLKKQANYLSSKEREANSRTSAAIKEQEELDKDIISKNKTLALLNEQIEDVMALNAYLENVAAQCNMDLNDVDGTIDQINSTNIKLFIDPVNNHNHEQYEENENSIKYEGIKRALDYVESESDDENSAVTEEEFVEKLRSSNKAASTGDKRVLSLKALIPENIQLKSDMNQKLIDMLNALLGKKVPLTFDFLTEIKKMDRK